MADKYAVVRTDNMYGTDVRAGLVSVKYIVETTVDDETVKTETEIENGSVLKLGALMDGEREVYEGSDVDADTAIEEVVLIASPEVEYDERLRNLDEFINHVGKPCRGYRLHSGDIFSVTKKALVGLDAPEKGNVVELKAGTKLNVAASATSGSTVVGKIHDVEIAGRYTYYAIQVC